LRARFDDARINTFLTLGPGWGKLTGLERRVGGLRYTGTALKIELEVGS
jgi:hypothetical protein